MFFSFARIGFLVAHDFLVTIWILLAFMKGVFFNVENENLKFFAGIIGNLFLLHAGPFQFI